MHQGQGLTSLIRPTATEWHSADKSCVTLSPWPLTFWPWRLVVYRESRNRPIHHIGELLRVLAIRAPYLVTDEYGRQNQPYI